MVFAGKGGREKREPSVYDFHIDVFRGFKGA